jgi:hypothetical protein
MARIVKIIRAASPLVENKGRRSWLVWFESSSGITFWKGFWGVDELDVFQEATAWLQEQGVK